MCLIALLFSTSILADNNQIFISPNGNDGADGSKARPFKTLERAKRAIRTGKAQGHFADGEITVWMRQGQYQLFDTFELNAQDSGSAQSPVYYRAYGQEEVRISGGINIERFEKVTDAKIASRFAPEAREHIVQADLNQYGNYDFNTLAAREISKTNKLMPSSAELFYDDHSMILARWPNQGWSKIVSLPTGYLSGLIEYEGDRPAHWSRIEDILLYGFWRYNFFANFEKVADIDAEKNHIQTAYVPPPPPDKPYGFFAGQPYFAMNVLEEIDSPKEWYIDRKSGILYFWPPQSSNGLSSGGVVSIMDEPLVKINGASHVHFEGQIFENTRGVAIEILGGSNNRIADCVVRNVGSVGVAIGGMVDDIIYKTEKEPVFSGLGGVNNGIEGCDIYNTGLGGVLLGGGDRSDLSRGENYVTNNHIYNYSRLARTSRPAIYIYGVGNRIDHNEIHDGPDLAVSFWGNDHLIEYNEMYKVGLLIDDGGAFKVGRDYTQRGTVIRYNYFHDLKSEVDGAHMGVYLDDFHGGMTIYGNLFYDVNVGVLIGGGRDNLIENNVFINNRRSIHIDARGTTWNKGYFDGTITALFDRLEMVNADKAPYATRYPELKTLLADEPHLPKGNRIIRNIVVNSMAPSLIERADKHVKMTDNLIGEDPGFVSLDKDSLDLRLTPESKAWAVGFKPIPIEKIGLYPKRKSVAVTQYNEFH